MSIEKSCWESVYRVESWVKTREYKGYDPFDLKGARKLLWIQKKRNVRRTFNILSEVFPVVLRRIWKIEKRQNAKAMGLFAKGFLTLFELTGDERYSDEVKQCLTWLVNNRSSDWNEYCWGYPFDWQSKILIPENTPSAVVTSIVADSFLSAFRRLNDEQWLNVAVRSCEFIARRLNVVRKSDSQLCFSYTPLDTFQIHNANLLSARILFKVGMETSNNEFLEKANQAVNYALDGQNRDGSWYYWGNDVSGEQGVIDNFHTGFNLRCLQEVQELKNDSRIGESLKKGYEFFKENLLVNHRIPKHTNVRRYPIDIHACAESILCLSILSQRFHDALPIAGSVSEWTLNNMYSQKGYFYYRKYPFFTSKIPFIRWGQAWMMLALMEFLAATRRK